MEITPQKNKGNDDETEPEIEGGFKN